LIVGFAWYHDKLLESQEAADEEKDSKDDDIGGQMFVSTFIQIVIFLSIYLYRRQVFLLDLFLESKENMTQSKQLVDFFEEKDDGVVIVSVKPRADVDDKTDFSNPEWSNIELDECIFGNSAMHNLIGSVDEIMKQARNPMFTIQNDRP